MRFWHREDLKRPVQDRRIDLLPPSRNRTDYENRYSAPSEQRAAVSKSPATAVELAYQRETNLRAPTKVFRPQYADSVVFAAAEPVNIVTLSFDFSPRPVPLFWFRYIGPVATTPNSVTELCACTPSIDLISNTTNVSVSGTRWGGFARLNVDDLSQ